MGGEEKDGQADAPPPSSSDLLQFRRPSKGGTYLNPEKKLREHKLWTTSPLRCQGRPSSGTPGGTEEVPL